MKKSLIILAFAATSCTTYVPYTTQVKNDLKAKGVSVEQTQFYVNAPIVLEKITTSSNVELEKGNITNKNEKVRDVIVFGKPLKKVKALGRDGVNSIDLFLEPNNPIRVYVTNDNYEFYRENKELYYDKSLYQIKTGNGAKVFINKKAYTKYSLKVRKVKGLEVGN